MQFAPSARQLLATYHIPFESWTIPDAERSRIADAPIGLAAFYTPGSRLGPTEIQMLQSIQFLIALDMSYLKAEFLTAPEQVGIIIHELGHVLNPAIYDPCSCMNAALDEELYADYYTIHCGYGSEFASAMAKMRQANVHGFASSSIQQRLDELASPSSIRLNLPPEQRPR